MEKYWFVQENIFSSWFRKFAQGLDVIWCLVTITAIYTAILMTDQSIGFFDLFRYNFYNQYALGMKDKGTW